MCSAAVPTRATLPGETVWAGAEGERAKGTKKTEGVRGGVAEGRGREKERRDGEQRDVQPWGQTGCAPAYLTSHVCAGHALVSGGTRVLTMFSAAPSNPALSTPHTHARTHTHTQSRTHNHTHPHTQTHNGDLSSTQRLLQ